MRLRRNFNPVEPTTRKWFYLEFGPELGGETIAQATFTCSVVYGTDATPSARVLGAAAIVGTQVGAFCGTFLPGVTYSLEATATTSTARVLPNNARVRCQAPGDR
jgi:hypothetical protein